ncbi:hypothetical protein ACFV1L_19325 [Kitasatospora sp. NPDC059646]|uniref:hypothetical protein n=1 Tax=Kitasatospora sp. NPDC059646 TaxID=3346893 RepID=UPI0036D1FA1D
MRRHYPRTSTLAVAALLLTACAGVTQYYEGTGLHDATTAEAVGDWTGRQQARLTLRADGTAVIDRLDGQDWDFDEGWQLSGTGRWELTDRDAGQELVVDLTARTATGLRAVDRRSPAPAPDGYRWRFHVKRDRQRELQLFAFVGDPDSGDAYLLTRAPAGPGSAPGPAVR